MDKIIRANFIKEILSRNIWWKSENSNYTVGYIPNKSIIFFCCRSSEDEYCPPESVEQIQCAVLDELHVRLGTEVDVQLAYQQDEEQQ